MARYLTGIQPSGILHIGNYFGALRPAVELQEQGDAFYFIADYHALTTLQNPAELRQNVLGVALDFLACGLDPQSRLFLSPIRYSDRDRVGLDTEHGNSDGFIGAGPFLQR